MPAGGVCLSIGADTSAAPEERTSVSKLRLHQLLIIVLVCLLAELDKSSHRVVGAASDKYHEDHPTAGTRTDGFPREQTVASERDAPEETRLTQGVGHSANTGADDLCSLAPVCASVWKQEARR